MSNIPKVLDYCRDLSRHYSKSSINVDANVEHRLQRRVYFTPEQLEFLQDLIVMGEREQVEVSGYTPDELMKMAEAKGHREGYLYALTYLTSIAETPENINVE